MAQFNHARYDIFKSQDSKNGHFDLKFDVEGKIIFAHKFMLSSVSEVLKAMVSDTWNNGDSIKIEAYSYKDYYEFLSFLYSGECKLTDENIFVMVDLAEFYQVESLHLKCDEFLSHKEYTSENVLMFLEKLLNYSLPLFEKRISSSLKEKRINLVEFEGFLNWSKEMIQKIISFEDRFIPEEKLFEKVYEWAENRAMKKREESIDESFKMNDAIKSEITVFLPNIRFKQMNISFLHKYVVKRGFLFTYDELSDILDNAKSDVKVKVTNEYGQSISCMLPLDSDVVENVKSLIQGACVSNNLTFVYWNKKFTQPLTPSQLMKKDGVEWYLVYLASGEICVMDHASLNSSYYLIAEMTSETSGFRCTRNCKIEID